jgi:glycosyltransferase involved in cell wall biosynthesis
LDVTLVVDALGPQLSGIGRYVWELCNRVPVDPGVGRAGFFANGSFLDDPRVLLAERPFHRRQRLPRWLGRRIVRRRLGGSIVHGPNYFLPSEADSGLITVHDLSVLHYPHTHPSERLRRFEQQFGSSLARATHVITDSETVRGEVIAEFGLDYDRVTAIPLGVGPEFHPRSRAEVEPQLAQFGLAPGGYALCVSTLEPRKKIAELLRAWRELPQPLRSSTPLVLAGAKGWLNEPLHDAIRDGIGQGWLKHLGFVPNQSLPALYSGASLFLYPSIYEGFGLPPVEAMASGVPVMVSKRSCLPEICGEPAAYVDPDDSEGFVTAIAEALTNGEWRERARKRGIERAAAYSWDKCASQTVELYRRSALQHHDRSADNTSEREGQF